LERRNHRSQTSPSAAAAESTAAEVTSNASVATAALKPTVPHPALRDSVATASDKATTVVSAPAAVKAVAATTAATETVKPPPKHLKAKAAATRASERPSVVAKRRNLLQLDGCDTSAVSSKESLQKPTAPTYLDPAGNPAAAPTPAPSPAPVRNLLMGTYSTASAKFTAMTGSTLVANSAARKTDIFVVLYKSDLYCYFYIYAKTIKILLLLNIAKA
jgi:hypothetical protein